MSKQSFTHVALAVADIDTSVDFYRRFASMEVVHERKGETGARTVWMNDRHLPFVLVLFEAAGASPLRRIARAVSRRLPAAAHLGIACESREQVDSLCALARSERRLRRAPRDAGRIVGYYGMIFDPDGYNLEVSFGQLTPTIGQPGGESQPSRTK